MAETPRLSAESALRLRLAALQLAPGAAPAPTTVAAVVTHHGAMQAQDYASGLWSLGVRLPGSTLADVEAALERREALRTWPMPATPELSCFRRRRSVSRRWNWSRLPVSDWRYRAPRMAAVSR